MDNSFFDPPELEVLYALTQLDGESQQQALGVTRLCYENPDHANQWVIERIEELHVCFVSGHPMFEVWGQKAYDKLFDMWHRMTGKGPSEYRYPATISWYVPEETDERKYVSYFELNVNPTYHQSVRPNVSGIAFYSYRTDYSAFPTTVRVD